MDTKHIIKSVLTLVLLSAISCTQSILDIDPYGDRTTDQYYSNAKELNEALIMCYQAMQAEAFELNLFEFENIASDDAFKGGSSPTDRSQTEQLSEFRPMTDNSSVRNRWQLCYRGIYWSNLVIANQENGADNPELTAQVVKQARFVRAFFYYFLLTTFGDVPLIDKPLNIVELNVERTPSSEVWAFVEEDFKAATTLPKKSEYAAKDMGRITSGAAYGYLAKAYMFQKKYSDAESALKAVIESGEYDLLPDYGEIFRKSGENSIESVFEIQHHNTATSNGGDGSEGTQIIVYCMSREVGGWGFDLPSNDLKEAYEPGDPRIIYTLVFDGDIFDHENGNGDIIPVRSNSTYSGSAPYHNYKVNFRKDEMSIYNQDEAFNIRHMRYADLLLLYAEVLNENGKSTEALPYLNNVRERARNTSPVDPRRTFLNYDLSQGVVGETLPPITTTNQAELREKIWHERRIELAMEYHRRVDLLRTDRLGDTMLAFAARWNTPKGRTFVKGQHELMPIPLQEITRTNGTLKQNPKY